MNEKRFSPSPPGPCTTTPATREACTVLRLSDDELEVIGHQISDALHPALACALAACCRNLWGVMRALLATLKARHAAARALAAMVGSSCAELSEAETLRWFNKGLTADHMATLGMLFSTGALSRLEQLQISCNRFGPAGGSALGDGLSCGAAPRLTYLNLFGSGMGDAGASALATALSRGAVPKLEVLYLGSNSLGDQGVAALAAPLRRRPALKQLSLKSNRIGDAGVAALVGNLGARELKKLQALVLDNNKIGDAGCATLAAALDGAALPAIKLMFPTLSPVPTISAGDAARQALSDALHANEKRAP